MLARMSGQTITAVMPIHAPPDENDLPAYLAAIERATGAKRTDVVSALSPARRDILAETIITVEGGSSRRNQFSAPG